MKSVYDNIYEIDNSFEGLHFDKVVGISIIGSPRSGANEHPIQYRATTNCRQGDDDCYEGIGWSPSEAIRNLLFNIRQWDCQTT